jgi:hypothetical protein
LSVISNLLGVNQRKTDVPIPKQLKKDANLFMKAIAIASNFVVEGDYKEIYGTSRIW